MLILGIDPGLANTGWGVVDSDGNRRRPVSYDVVKTTPDMSEQMRIHAIATAIGQVAESYRIRICGMEDIFFTKNISSAISVAKVIGAVSHELATRGVTTRLFSPVDIKKTVTGYGNAEKEQVELMVKLLLGLKETPRPDHAADALAAALCLSIYNQSGLRMRER